MKKKPIPKPTKKRPVVGKRADKLLLDDMPITWVPASPEVMEQLRKLFKAEPQTATEAASLNSKSMEYPSPFQCSTPSEYVQRLQQFNTTMKSEPKPDNGIAPAPGPYTIDLDEFLTSIKNAILYLAASEAENRKMFGDYLFPEKRPSQEWVVKLFDRVKYGL